MGNNSRIDYIDGIKGICALFVVFCHLACVFMPNLCYLNETNTVFERIWINTPLNIITNGKFPVCTFFVVSGFLIAKKTQNKKTVLSRKIVNIYLKMLKIVIPGILFSFILMKLGLMKHLEALSINSNLGFVSTYNNFDPTIIGMIKDIIFTFINGSSYNGPLWTVVYEVLGSITIYVFSSLMNNIHKNRKLIYIVISIASIFISTYILSFFLGAFVFECIAEKDNSLIDVVIKWITKEKWSLLFLLILGMYFASINTQTTGIWEVISYIPKYAVLNDVIRSIGVAMVLYCVYNLQKIKNLLSCRLFVYLGRISQYIYIFHWPIILSSAVLFI